MAQIEVIKQDPETFAVTVTINTTTVHIVTLKHDYYQKLTGGKAAPERLTEKSFEFSFQLVECSSDCWCRILSDSADCVTHRAVMQSR
jgi:hypothetical protein